MAVVPDGNDDDGTAVLYCTKQASQEAQAACEHIVCALLNRRRRPRPE